MINSNDLLVFSHLRWNFVFQRPQHLMTRFAKHRRVFFIEEPTFEDVSFPKIHTQQSAEGVFVITPYLPRAFSNRKQDQDMIQAVLLEELLLARNITNYSAWYYTPMSLTFTRQLTPKHIIFDIMDELSLFKEAPVFMKELESELFEKTNLAFASGQSLFKAKFHRHANIHVFPNSIDKAHFGQARLKNMDPVDQINIPHPRIGFFGAIDERIDLQLLSEMSRLKPDLQFVMIGPVVRIDSSTLPQSKNIHYLGQKSYYDLPKYASAWDCAMMPFALNESTRLISPTKTPEFLAAGLPVVSTAIKDVVTPYGDEKLVRIAKTAAEFIESFKNAFNDKKNIKWQLKVDSFLADISWDVTWLAMATLENEIELNAKIEKNTSRISVNQDTFYSPAPS